MDGLSRHHTRQGQGDSLLPAASILATEGAPSSATPGAGSVHQQAEADRATGVGDGAGFGRPERAGEGGAASAGAEIGERQEQVRVRRGPAPVTAGQPVRRHPLG